MSSRRIKIAANTGGGGAPGLNAVICAVTLAAELRGWDVCGIRMGYHGLLDTDEIVHLTPDKVQGIVSIGGTILGATNKGNPFSLPVRHAAGDVDVRFGAAVPLDSDSILTARETGVCLGN